MRDGAAFSRVLRRGLVLHEMQCANGCLPSHRAAARLDRPCGCPEGAPCRALRGSALRCCSRLLRSGTVGAPVVPALPCPALAMAPWPPRLSGCSAVIGCGFNRPIAPIKRAESGCRRPASSSQPSFRREARTAQEKKVTDWRFRRRGLPRASATCRPRDWRPREIRLAARSSMPARNGLRHGRPSPFAGHA
jgi:hypothetical protein